MSVWQFVQDQVLGMRWLNTLINQLLTAVGLDTQSRIGGSVQFFLYDVLKITVLLCLLIFLISYVQSYFPPERSKKIMGRFHGLWANCVGRCWARSRRFVPARRFRCSSVLPARGCRWA